MSSIVNVQQGGASAASSFDLGEPHRRALRVLRWVGVLLVAVTLVDVALVFVPPQWGSRDWLLTTIVQAANGLPVLAVGLGAMTAAVAALRERGAARALGAAHVALVLAIFVMLLTFAPAAAAALRTTTGGLGSGLGRATIRTVAYAVIFSALHLTLAAVCWRAGRVAVARADA